jgi:hypothetical protein
VNRERAILLRSTFPRRRFAARVNARLTGHEGTLIERACALTIARASLIVAHKVRDKSATPLKPAANSATKNQG